VSKNTKPNLSKPSPLSPRLLRIADAAEYLSASVWFVRSLIWEDKIPFLHLGQRFVIDKADLDRFVDAAKQGATR
jgi:excisionase family DNA binding protein